MGFKAYHLETCMGEARHTEAFREADARRRHELDRILREDGYCKFCRLKLSEAQMQRTPGVCGNRECRRRKGRGE